jgi:hypothetical protein
MDSILTRILMVAMRVEVPMTCRVQCGVSEAETPRRRFRARVSAIEERGEPSDQRSSAKITVLSRHRQPIHTGGDDPAISAVPAP